MADLTVACVLRSGGQYDAGHVDGLAAQVAHWLPAARFVCLSDVPVRCERVALQSQWPGWWAKVELFRHFTGRTLYLDLDSVIVGDPLPLLGGRFTMVRNWLVPRLRTSAVMSWDGDHSHIADAFEPVAERVMAEYVTPYRWGDQAFIAEQAGAVDTFAPGVIASFRYDHIRVRSKEPPKHARVVAFNGTCPPWTHGPAWARQWWEPKDDDPHITRSAADRPVREHLGR